MSLVFVKEVINETDCIHHITDNLYLGNCNSRNHINKYNISRIIEIGDKEEIEKYPLIPENLKKLTINIPDNRNVNILEYFEDIFSFIKQDNSNVLIHCKMGTSRSVAFVISYLIKYENMTFENSLKLIKEKRNDNIYTKPNVGFTKILKNYYKKLYKFL